MRSPKAHHKRSRPLIGGRSSIPPYRGAGGIVSEVFYIAVLDRNNVPIKRISRAFDTMYEALPAWYSTRHRGSSLVRETLFRTIEL